MGKVWTRSLLAGPRSDKFAELLKIRLDDDGWLEASDHPRAPFAPMDNSIWSTYPSLSDLFVYNGSGAMIGRTWPVAPDPATLNRRAQKLLATEDIEAQRSLFLEHPRDRRVDKEKVGGLPGYKDRQDSVRGSGELESPARYSFRSLDRQWIIPDKRVINQPNPGLWAAAGSAQIYLTAPNDERPRGGPATSVAASPPDMHHYGGRGGRVFPLRYPTTATSNVRSDVVDRLAAAYAAQVSPDDVFFYVVGLTAHPKYLERFKEQLSRPGVRVPFTTSKALFAEVASLGRRSVFLQTFGLRGEKGDYATSSTGAPRLPSDRAPHALASAPMPSTPEAFPDSLEYDEPSKTLLVGSGGIGNVTSEIRNYEIDGVRVVDRWFSYRRADRTKPSMENRRESELDRLMPDSWPAGYTSDLIDLLNVIGLLVDLETAQEDALARVAEGETIAGLVPDPYAEVAPTVTSSESENLLAERHGQVTMTGFDDLE
jgi:hypothetical protein